LRQGRARPVCLLPENNVLSFWRPKALVAETRRHTRKSHLYPQVIVSVKTYTNSEHNLRHTCALTVLQATKDLRKVSLWLGHAHMQTTEMYTRVDPSVKLEALESVMPPKLRSGRFKATDKLIASLKAATFMRSKNPSK
jgi:integrase/recombinase XerD